MPRWILTSPPDSCPKSEQDTAALLDKLGPEFSVRWGFHYTDHRGTLREGDFVIQGPDGHLLVLEAKGGPCELDPATGRWSTADGENPFTQVEAEKAGVLAQVREFAAHSLRGLMPFIDSALALPDVEIDPAQPLYQAHPRAMVAAANDLHDLATWWARRFGARHLYCSPAEARRIFQTLFAAGAPESAMRHMLDLSAQILERHTRQRFEILDALEENHQLLVSGGPGTGKTWLALEQAKRWAKQGQSVLFLCYNLELEAYLRPLCARISPAITVLSYEALAWHILGERIDTSALSREEKTDFFDRTLPEKLRAAVEAPGFQPQFDALVVDEAQDHNTGDGPADPGWWGIYWKLLRRGGEAPVAIFHDASQRLCLRHGAFDPAHLRDHLLQPVSVRLRHPVRYTRQLRRFIAGLKSPATADLIRDFESHHPLPEGPDPEIHPISSPHEEGQKCALIVKNWIDSGLAKCHEAGVLYPSSRNPPAWLGKIHGINFSTAEQHDTSYSRLNPAGLAKREGGPSSSAPHSSTNSEFHPKFNIQNSSSVDSSPAIACYSINRAKGLERRAIILTGLPPWEVCATNDYQARIQNSKSAKALGNYEAEKKP